jgi:putative aldouronate transport system substrate-binding protein
MGKIVAIRQDLADKYGISALENWDDFMNYMITIAEKETPESGIYAMAASGSNPELWDIYRQRFDGFYGLQDGSISMLFKFDGETLPTKDDMKLTYEYPEFRDFCKDMKKLADAGCWSRSALTNTISDDDAFAALQGAAIAWNASVFTYMKSAEKNEGVTCMAYDLTKDTFVSAEAYSNNDMAIAAASRNPERAAMVLDLIKYDTYLNRLLLLGIEGVHYSINNETGEYTKLEKNGDYPPLSVSVAWAVKNGNLTESGTPERELAITDEWAKRVKSNPTVTFVFDDSEISEYVSAVNSVLGEYTGMLQLGLVDDVDATVDEMLSRIYDAGMQEVYDEFYRQYDAWYQTR